MMPPPPKKYTNIRIWHHLQVFFDGGGVKRKLKVGQIQKIFSNQMWHHLQVVFFGGGVKKNSNKKSQITRAKCTSALAWSNSKIPVVIFLTPPTFFQWRWCQKSFQSTQMSKISGFDTTSMFFRHHLHVFLMEVVSKNVQIKKARAAVQNARVLWLGRSTLNFFQTQMSETGLAGLWQLWVKNSTWSNSKNFPTQMSETGLAGLWQL